MGAGEIVEPCPGAAPRHGEPQRTRPRRGQRRRQAPARDRPGPACAVRRLPSASRTPYWLVMSLGGFTLADRLGREDRALPGLRVHADLDSAGRQGAGAGQDGAIVRPTPTTRRPGCASPARRSSPALRRQAAPLRRARAARTPGPGRRPRSCEAFASQPPPPQASVRQLRAEAGGAGGQADACTVPGCTRGALISARQLLARRARPRGRRRRPRCAAPAATSPSS